MRHYHLRYSYTDIVVPDESQAQAHGAICQYGAWPDCTWSMTVRKWHREMRRLSLLSYNQ